jgi:hypothetical protein
MKTFLAVYTGRPMDQHAGPPSDDVIARGMKAWQDWMVRHADALVVDGGPLGKTKKISADGVSDISNQRVGYVVVRAESHAAAARMFENHPHFAIFPGEGVEVMEVMPMPGE